MCYSAAVMADHAAFQRLFPTTKLSLKDFFELYWRKKTRPKPLLRTSRAMDALFAHPRNDEERHIRELIEEIDAAEALATQQLLFEQRTRLADAERKLQVKTTKTALNDQRIATKKVSDALARLASMQRTELRESDTRIFPGWMAPVLLLEDGQPVIRPMRYLCRPPGMPASIDDELPGLYNARRDNLRKFWRGTFGRTHAVMLAATFFEHVKRHVKEHRELQPGEKPEDIVLRFEPRPPRTMWIACMYSHWKPLPDSGEEDLWSFAAITDEPPPEVAEAGHDRCIVQLRPENVAAWLSPAGRSLDDLDQLLEDKEPAYYEHEELKAA